MATTMRAFDTVWRECRIFIFSLTWWNRVIVVRRLLMLVATIAALRSAVSRDTIRCHQVRSRSSFLK